MDYELVGEREGKKEIPGLGKIVDFKVVDAFPFHPQIRVYGVESRYEIRVESAELDKIRKDLTGLPPSDHGFCINVGVRMENMLDKTEEETETNSKSSTSKPMPEPEVESVKTKPASTLGTSRSDDEEEIKASEAKVAPASKSKTEKASSKSTELAEVKMKLAPASKNKSEKSSSNPKKLEVETKPASTSETSNIDDVSATITSSVTNNEEMRI